MAEYIPIARLFCGFYSVFMTITGDCSTALITLVVVVIFDGRNIYPARLTNSTYTVAI
jgi:phosphatidylserine synthase